MRITGGAANLVSEITLIVRVKAKRGREHALERELRISVPPTHKEEGCLRFALHRSMKEAGEFLLIERWTSQSALDEHLRKPYLITLLEKLKDLAQSSEASAYEMLVEGDTQKLL